MSLVSMVHELQNRFCSCMNPCHQHSSAGRRTRSSFRTRPGHPKSAPFPKVYRRSGAGRNSRSPGPATGPAGAIARPPGHPEVGVIHTSELLLSAFNGPFQSSTSPLQGVDLWILAIRLVCCSLKSELLLLLGTLGICCNRPVGTGYMF